jgi:tetratricopeptide (TPR) repeat protein
MKKGAPVDAMPEFKPLTIASSNLMIEANALRAQGEIFESAVKWVEAGRKLAELGTRLLHAGHNHEAAQDVLNSAACFLEPGHCALAGEQLFRLASVRELNDEVVGDEYLSDAQQRLSAEQHQRQKAFEETCKQARNYMKADPHRHDRLPTRWFDDALARFPGVPELHWGAAQMWWKKDSRAKALEHHQWAARLRPDDVGFRVALVQRLLEAQRWKEAITAGNEAASVLPCDPYVRWSAGWAGVRAVVAGRQSKSTLAEAGQHLAEADKFRDALPERFAIAVGCARAVCLRRQGNEAGAKKCLEDLLEHYSSAATDIVWQMLRSKPAGREKMFVSRCAALVSSDIQARFPEQNPFSAAA